MEVIEIVKSFVEEKKKEDESIIGAIFYGSNCYGSAKKDSDVDILFVSKGKYCYRGLETWQNYRMEYFMKPYQVLERECMTDFSDQDTFLLAVFENGTKIEEQDHCLTRLHRRLLLRSRAALPNYQISREEKDNFQKKYQELSYFSDESFWILYYNLLNELRILYQMKYGYTRIPTAKVLEFYQNRPYAEKYYCAILPPEEITNTMLVALKTKQKEEALESLKKLASTLHIQLSDLKALNLQNSFYQSPSISYFNPPKIADLKEQVATVMTKYLRAKNKLIQNEEDASFLYAVTLERMRTLYEVQNSVLNKSFLNAIYYYQNMDTMTLPKIDQAFAKTYLNATKASDNAKKIQEFTKVYQMCTQDVPIKDTKYLIRIKEEKPVS